jgi:hypothetical protein
VLLLSTFFDLPISLMTVMKFLHPYAYRLSISVGLLAGCYQSGGKFTNAISGMGI